MDKRQVIWDKSRGKCWYCGCELPKKGWHADHVKPIRRHFWKNSNDCDNPENEGEENKVPTCASCNIQKGSLSVEAFRSKIAGFVNSLNQYHTQYAVAKRYGLVAETGASVVFWHENQEVKQNDCAQVESLTVSKQRVTSAAEPTSEQTNK